MVIYYDSTDNKLKFSGDRNADNQIDTPNAITIRRDNNYVGILNDNPSVPLEVGGAITASGTIRSTAGFRFPDNTIQSTAVSLSQFAPVATSGSYTSLYNLPTFGAVATSGNYNDLINKPSLQPVATTGSYTSLYNLPSLSAVATSGNYNDLTNTPTIPTIPSYLFTPSYFKCYFLKGIPGRLSENYEPGDQGSFFDTTTIPINIGSYSVAINAITIPADGVYDISYCMLIRSENSGQERKNLITYVRINNANPDGEEQALAGSYLRYISATNNRENCQSASTILQLNQNDLVSLWNYREGGTGTANIQHGHFQIRRIA